ncbi:hypothetical protein QVD17_33238 [Tagetes erecta]|uniref:Uncharacterized protein n=1 Tax=Tagetes erecta TaxID=13708 RepID=A0AAD8JYK6_TARER|nr:hypothetical protein QVD17_33238 [Tagetes erecta]
MARAVWKRATNRYFIQEDAKSVSKLACCSSISSAISKIDAKSVNFTDLDDSLCVSDEKSFYTNLEFDSTWWIKQPDYAHQRGLTNQEVNSLESNGSYEFVQMAEKDDLGSFGLKKSHVLIESCDLGSKAKCDQNVMLYRSRPDTSRTKVLEALCHSQTRAREAEIAAKKAYAEKEHAIRIVFRQASQLFAYRQWIYVLQLENLCYQMKNSKIDPMLSVIPILPSKIGKCDKNLKNVTPANGKRTLTRRGFGRYGRGLGQYAVVFVVGLGIVGVGLVFGWTVGWMLI